MLERKAAAAVVTVVLGGVLMRGALVAAAPRWGYVLDHFEVIGMGLVASERGILHAYSATAEDLPVIRGVMLMDGNPVLVDRRSIYAPNYPPLSILIFWAQSAWLRATVSPLVVNTAYTRLVTSVAPWVGEAAVAVAVGLLTAALTPIRGRAIAAAAVAWLSPPLMMNTTLWSQYDALTLAASVLAVLAMVRGRWTWAGIAAGTALLIKPQGLLLAPIALFAAAVGAMRDGAIGAGATMRRAAVMLAAGIATFALGSAPWLLGDGPALLRRCFQANLFEVLPYTTLEAYNLWYLVALLRERAPVFDVLTATAPLGGATPDAWGRVLLALGLVAAAWLCWSRWRGRPDLAVVLFAALWLWSVFIWPTRVHERYILFCLPFVIVAAAVVPRLRWIAAALVLVATMEHGWMIWRSGAPVGTFDRQSVDRLQGERMQAYWQGRPVTIENAKAGPQIADTTVIAFAHYREERRRSIGAEWAVTLLSLAAYAAAMMVAARPRPAVRT